MGCNFSDLNGCRIWSCFHKMQLLGILLAANRVHTVNFQAFLASDKFPICLVTVFVFVFFNICICVVRQLYYLDILAVHALLGNNTSNHSSSSHIWALQSRILHYRTFVPIKFSYISSYKHYQMAFALAPHSCQNLHFKSCFLILWKRRNTADGYFNNIESALLHPNNSVWAQNDPFCFQT